MKYLKTFENFDFGDRFSNSDADEQEWLSHVKQTKYPEQTEEEEECAPCEEEEEEMEEEEMEDTPRVWGDEVVEKKKVNAGLQAYLDKQKAKKEDKKEDKGSKKAKPDFLDLDKDGDKKEPMKKAAKDAKEKDSKEDKGGKGLSAAQKKLPAGLQKAILAKKK